MGKATQKVKQTESAPAKVGGPFKPGYDPRRGKNGGRPVSQHSLSYWVKEFGNTSPEALAEQFTLYAEQLKQGGKLPFFALIAVRILMGASNEPDVALLALLFDRTEGKLTERVTDVPWEEEAKKYGVDPEKVRQTIGPLFAKVPAEVVDPDD